MPNSAWPSHFTVRAPLPDEAQAVTDLIIARNMADWGEPDWTLEDVQSDWDRFGFDLARDARVVVAPDGRLAAYADVYRRPNAVQIGENSGVHPDFRGQLSQDTFAALAESLAAQHAPLPVQWMSEANRGRFLVERGYAPARYLWQMRIELTEPPSAPQWPDGYVVRLMTEADERATYELIEVAFVRPGRAPVTFEEWRHYMVERNDTDPTLQFVAVRGQEIAGACLCMTYTDPDEGWVRQLAVAKLHRGQGLGAALLRHAFGEFYRRGIMRAGLGVDANNPSATKLYKGVGMTAVRDYIQYQKAQELAPPSV